MTNIFFDLDGTLINSQHRLYNLFVELCPECKMTYDEYWDIKRTRINQKDFLQKYFNYSDKQCAKIHKLWLEKIEEPERLKQDFLVNGIEKELKKLYKKYDLYIITNRQTKEPTIKEIEFLGIKKYFKNILVTEQKKTKEELIKETIKLSANDILIGDSGEDITCAKALGIKSIAVSWGILNKNILKEYLPNFLISDIDEITMKLGELWISYNVLKA